MGWTAYFGGIVAFFSPLPGAISRDDTTVKIKGEIVCV